MRGKNLNGITAAFEIVKGKIPGPRFSCICARIYFVDVPPNHNDDDSSEKVFKTSRLALNSRATYFRDRPRQFYRFIKKRIKNRLQDSTKNSDICRKASEANGIKFATDRRTSRAAKKSKSHHGQNDVAEFVDDLLFVLLLLQDRVEVAMQLQDPLEIRKHLNDFVM